VARSPVGEDLPHEVLGAAGVFDTLVAARSGTSPAGRSGGGACEGVDRISTAIGLYRKSGFVEEGRRVKHYRRASGELWDALEMGLLL
jgi:ribosomal protein S18 acetylase RimI-like enzyme